MLSRVVRATAKKCAAQQRRSFSIAAFNQSVKTQHQCTRLPSVSVNGSFTQSAVQSKRFFSVEIAKVPSLGDSITEGTVVKWNKNIGEFVEQDEVLVIIETDKVSVDIRAQQAGKLVKQLANEGDTIKVNDSLAEIDTSAKAEAKPAAAEAKPAAKEAPKEDRSHIHSAQPAQTSQGQEREGSNAAAPKSSGGVKTPSESTTQPGSKNVESSKSSPSSAPSVAMPAPGSRGVRRVPMSRMRITIANRLKAAQNSAAMLTTFNEIDMTNIMELRSRYKDEFQERTGAKLGFMSAFVKASTAALRKFPDVNASIEGNEVVYHDYCDVSVAVSTPTGLVVPVLRNTEAMSFAQVEANIAALGQKARKGQIALEDMTGGTFTISNGGVYGSLFGTPIINPPQTAILGMHGIFKRPVVVGDKIEARPMMYIALTYDHKLIDGSTAVQFLKEIKMNVEDPGRLLLDM